jgi:HK97 family phage major capsid protein
MPIDPDFDFTLGDSQAYRNELFEDAQTMLVRSGNASFTDDEQTSFDAITEEIEKVDAIVARQARIRQLEARGSVDEAPTYEVPEFTVSHNRDVFDLQNANRLHGEHRTADLKARALTAIEQAPSMVTDEVRSQITALIEHDGAEFTQDGTVAAKRGAKAEHLLSHGSPQYVREFNEFMRNPARGPSDHIRAMSEGSSSVGGAILPYFLDPTIILTNGGVVSPIRSLATVKQITTNIWHGVTSAGVTAEWIGEATEVADASPTLAAPSITAYKADAYIQASMELIQDSALSGEITMLLAEAKSRLEGTAFVTGTGSSQPKGLVTALSGTGPQLAGSSGAAGAADLVSADIFALQQGLPPRWRGNGATFLGSLQTLNKIRQLNAGTAAYQSTFWADFGAGTPPNLIGYPIYEVSDMDTTIVSGSNDDVLLFGDVSQYYIIDRIGMEIAYNPLVVGASRRPTGESGWVAFWRTGADVVTSNAFRLLRL